MPTANFNGIQLKSESRDNKGTVKYSLNGNKPVLYSKPVLITKDQEIAVQYFQNNKVVNTQAFKISFNKATGKKVSITKTPNEKYPGQPGAFSLVNGIFSNKGLSYPDWLGWIGDDMEATIDLGKTESFSTIRIHTLDQNGSWVYLPQYVEVLTSTDGKNFTAAGRSSDFVKDNLTMGWITIFLPLQQKPFIKVVAKNYGMIADGKPGAGNKAWLFCDEIQVK